MLLLAIPREVSTATKPVVAVVGTVALIWVNSGSGAIMRMEGYDRQGKLIKRYEVISGMKVGDAWMLKQMRIETFNPTTKNRVGRTYLELEK